MIKPFEDRIIVEEFNEHSLIIISKSGQPNFDAPAIRGTVMEVGEGSKEFPVKVRKGQRVWFYKSDSKKIEFLEDFTDESGKVKEVKVEYLILTQSGIIGIDED